MRRSRSTTSGWVRDRLLGGLCAVSGIGRRRWCGVRDLSRRGRFVAAAAVFALLGAACGGGDDSDGSADTSGGTVAPAEEECPVDALAGMEKPVEITFWHQLQANNETVLQRQVARFNSSQDAVRVELLYFGQDMLTKYRAGMGTGDLPALLQIEETQVQAMVDSRGTIPMQACVDASKYPLDDFIPRALAFYTTQDVLRSMPWNPSHPILLYNRKAFAQAGLDPDAPPKTLDEVRAAAEKIVDSGAAVHGLALRVKPFFNEFWYALDGQVYANNGNGRDERATKAELDNATGLAVWKWLDDMVDSGLALNSGPSDSNPDNLLAIGTGQAAMTFDSSSVVGPVLSVLGSGQFPGVEIGAAPFPGLTEGGGLEIGEGSLWILDGPPEQMAAAWAFVQFLVDPEQLVELHTETNYIPIRRSVAEDPRVLAHWEEQPIFRVAYDQLAAGPETDATAGAVIGDFQGVRDAVDEALTAMLAGKLTPEEALAQAQLEADAAIADYNDRLGL